MAVLNPQMVSARSGIAPLPVPAGAVVAWSGLVAAIPAGWSLCDGSNGTPNLAGKFIRAAGGAVANRATGSGGVSGTTSTDGAHTGPLNAPGGNSNTHSVNYGYGSSDSSNGAHAHTLTGTVDQPPHYTLAYIRANAAANLPAGAVIWTVDADAPASMSLYGTLAGKMIKGATDNTRQAGGAQNRTYAVSTSTAGAHSHGPSDPGPSGGTNYYSAITAGGHDHGTITSGAAADAPWLALTPLLVQADTPSRSRLVLAYDGDVAALPSGWKEYAAISGLFPIGVDATHPLAGVGGTAATTALSGSISSLTVTHNHASSTSGGGLVDQVSPHGSYAWAHGHTWSGTLDPLPPWLALHYITRDAA